VNLGIRQGPRVPKRWGSPKVTGILLEVKDRKEVERLMKPEVMW